MEGVKTLRGAALANASLNIYPDELAHWWKCSEETGATLLIDSVSGANIPIAAITAAAGIITTEPNITDVDLAASLQSIGTSDFIFIFRGQTSNLGSIKIGESTGPRINLNGSLLGASQVVGASGTTNTDAHDNSVATWAVVRDSNDSGNIAVYKDGAIVGVSDADGSGSIVMLPKMTFSAADNMAGMALYIYESGLPADWTEIVKFNGTSWAQNEKIVYPK